MRRTNIFHIKLKKSLHNNKCCNLKFVCHNMKNVKKCSADKNFEINFGVNSIIGFVETFWDLLLLTRLINFTHYLI